MYSRPVAESTCNKGLGVHYGQKLGKVVKATIVYCSLTIFNLKMHKLRIFGVTTFLKYAPQLNQSKSKRGILEELSLTLS